MANRERKVKDTDLVEGDWAEWSVVFGWHFVLQHRVCGGRRRNETVTGAVRTRRLVKPTLISPVSARWDIPRAPVSLTEDEVKLKVPVESARWQKKSQRHRPRRRGLG